METDVEMEVGREDEREVESCPRYMECVETKESRERVCDAAAEGRPCGKSRGRGVSVSASGWGWLEEKMGL